MNRGLAPTQSPRDEREESETRAFPARMARGAQQGKHAFKIFMLACLKRGILR